MKLQISLSASDVKFKKGERVVCKVGKNEWYQGTVLRSGAKLKVEFDDGHEADITPEDYGDVKLIDVSTKPRKKFLTNAQAMQLYLVKPKAAKKAAAVKKPAIKKPAIKKPVVKNPASKAVKKNTGTHFMSGSAPILQYLEGWPPPQEWVDNLMNVRSKDQPDELYRLCVVSMDAKVGTTFSVPKNLISASDRVENAVRAGRSYHSDWDTNLKGKQFGLIEIEEPVVLMSYADIAEEIKNDKFALSRLHSEREYLIRGPIKGKIIQIIPVTGNT